MKIEEALEYICEEARRQGADKFDALASESDSLGIEIFEGKIKNTEISNSRGVGIRLFKAGRPGYSFTEKFSRESVALAVRDALDHAALTDVLDLELPRISKLPEFALHMYNPALEDVDLAQMKELGLAVESAALSHDRRVENVPHLGVSRSQGRRLMQNSNGVFYESQRNSVSAWVGVVAALGDVRKMGFYSNGGRSFDLDVLRPEHMATRAVERAVELLGARPGTAGPGAVVLSNRVSGGLLSMFGSPFHAENVQKGQSRLAGRLGESIAPDFFNLTDNPHIPLAPGSRLFDGEGTLTQPRVLIRDGALAAFLYNLEAAKKDGVEAPGNAIRGYRGQAGTGFSNMILAKGDQSLEELLAAFPRCLLVTKLEGGSGCSAVSGEISIGVQGFLYENGQRAHPVDKMTVNSNFFDMLGLIRGLSNQYSDAFSSVRAPDILVESMHLGA